VSIGIDHGGNGGTSPQNLEWGTLMQIAPQILSYRYKYERSVAFKIRFPSQGSALDPAGGAHEARRDPLVRWRSDTPPHISPHSAPTRLRRPPCVPQNSRQIYAYTSEMDCEDEFGCSWWTPALNPLYLQNPCHLIYKTVECLHEPRASTSLLSYRVSV